MTLRRALFVGLDTLLWAWFGLALIGLVGYALEVIL